MNERNLFRFTHNNRCNLQTQNIYIFLHVFNVGCRLKQSLFNPTSQITKEKKVHSNNTNVLQLKKKKNIN